MSKVAFLGTGLMGAGMVEAMLGRGETVTVWNRTAAKARPLADKGATVAESPASCVRGADRVHLMLTDDAVVDAVLGEALGALAPGALVIDHSTTLPEATAARFARLAGTVAFVHAPVFMSPAMCRAAKGLMLASASEATYAKASKALAAMTGEVWYLGERTDLAAAYKLFGNALLIVSLAGLADVFAMARGLGVDPAASLTLLSKFNVGAAMQFRGAAMAKGEYAPSFEMTMARKDVRLMIESAARSSLPLATLPSIAARMDQLIAEGHGALDMSALSIAAVPPKG